MVIISSGEIIEINSYQQAILRTDENLNAFGSCPKCFWDIADHEIERSQSGIFAMRLAA